MANVRPAPAGAETAPGRTGPTPRYRLTERAYFDKIYNVDDEIETWDIPGPHMDPLNASAKRMAADAPAYRDPINSIPIGTMGDTNPPDVV